METTTVRVKKKTQERLKKLAAANRISVTELVEKLVTRHGKSFWDGFDGEAGKALDKREKKARKGFEGTLKDGL